jgi:gluconokinase
VGWRVPLNVPTSPLYAARVLIVVMGVTGAGKSSVGVRVAQALGLPFLDADDFHDPSAIASMHAGRPLSDARRQPWLQRLHEVLLEHRSSGAVLACSALTRAYRDVLRVADDDPEFVYLAVSEATLERRLGGRVGHFAGADLVPSQLATLELGDDVIVVDGEQPVDQVVDAVLAAVAGD